MALYIVAISNQLQQELNRKTVIPMKFTKNGLLVSTRWTILKKYETKWKLPSSFPSVSPIQAEQNLQNLVDCFEFVCCP